MMAEYEFRGIDVITDVMEEAGFRLVSAEGGTMDSGLAVFEGDAGTVRIVKDRGQWMYEGDAQTLEPYGLWRAFDDLEEFIIVIRRYHEESGSAK